MHSLIQCQTFLSSRTSSVSSLFLSLPLFAQYNVSREYIFNTCCIQSCVCLYTFSCEPNYGIIKHFVKKKYMTNIQIPLPFRKKFSIKFTPVFLPASLFKIVKSVQMMSTRKMNDIVYQEAVSCHSHLSYQ